MIRAAFVACVAVACLFVARASGEAECLSDMTAQQAMQGPNELVFSGIVVRITRTADLGYRATFDVDRVWKGVVSKRFDVYVWELAPEGGRFEMSKRYLVIAERLTESRAREGVGLAGTDAIAFTRRPCTGPNELGPNIIQDLGVGKPPQ